MSLPGPLDPPPEDFAKRGLPRRDMAGPLYRFHSGHRSALHFGKSALGRYDAPDRSYGVLYAARDVHGAFAEAYQPFLGGGALTAPELTRKRLARIDVEGPLRLVDLITSGHLARIGADARLFAGDHAVARMWSKAIHEHPECPDGVLVPARHDPTRAVCAIFDRASKTLRATTMGTLAEPGNAALLDELLETYGVGLVGLD